MGYMINGVCDDRNVFFKSVDERKIILIVLSREL